MFDYWVSAGLLWTLIVKAAYRSDKVLTISKEGISISKGTYKLDGGVVTLAQLEKILRDVI